MPEGKYVGRYRVTGDSIAMDFAQRRVRDADVPAGEWRGTHPAGSRYFEESNGELTIYNAKDEPMCIYSPGSFRIHEDATGVHVARLGNHNPNPDPEVPERIDVQDSVPVILAKMNRRNADFWRNRGKASDADPGNVSDRALHSGIVAGSSSDTPAAMQQRLKAINQANRNRRWS